MSIEKRIRRRTLTDTAIGKLPRKRKRYIISDPEQRNMFIRVMPHGAHVFVCVVRNTFGTQLWVTLGDTSHLTVAEAREKARTVIKRVKEGLPPVEPPKLAPDSTEVVCRAWLERVVLKKGYRTASEKIRVVEKYIIPHLGRRPFAEVRRSDVTALLDYIEDKNGAHMADSVLSVMRAISHWVSGRDESYAAPFTKGMGRVDTEAKARSRILKDHELRAVWRAADDAGAFGDLVRLLILTAQRRAAVRGMKWADIDLKAGTWNVPQEARAKGTGGLLRLPALAIDIIRRQPRLVGVDTVFVQPRMNMVRPKRKLDEASGVSGYTLHDLRRSSKSLMARADVRPDVSERVLGHAIGGVEGVYDQHHYDDHKRDALQRLADLIDRILEGKEDDTNVVQLDVAAAS